MSTLIDDRQVCPQCQELRPVWYKWGTGAVLLCECFECGRLFKMPTRDERAALVRALQTIADVAAKGRG